MDTYQIISSQMISPYYRELSNNTSCMRLVYNALVDFVGTLNLLMKNLRSYHAIEECEETTKLELST